MLILLFIGSVFAFEPPKASMFQSSVDFESAFSGRLYGREPRGPIVAEGVATHKSPYGLEPFKDEYRVDNVKESSVKIPPSSGPSPGYRPPPPPVRREVDHNPICNFDADKWSVHVDTSITHAVMFERTTGGTCEDCLKNCTLRQETPWVCRSIVFDARWSICDLFAVTASAPPFDLVEFEGRQYMEFLPAMPPSDVELRQLVKIADRDQSSKPACQPAEKAVEKVKKREEGGQGGLYGAIPIEEQIVKEEKTAELEKKREHKKALKQGKVEKNPVDAVVTTTTTTTTEAPTTTTTKEETTTTEEEEELTTVKRTTVATPTTTMEKIKLSGEAEQAMTTMIVEDDLFETEEDTTPISVKPRRIVFKRTGVKSSVRATVAPLPEEEYELDLDREKEIISSCTDDDVVAMVEFISTSRRHPIKAELKQKKAGTAEECSEMCEKDEDCSSALFSDVNCELATTKSRRARTDLITVPGSTYVEKVCLRKNVAKDRGTLFSAVRNFIITEFVEEVEDARSMEDCIGMCLKSDHKHGFNCLSAMWYPGDKEQNCVLNREAGSRKPEHFRKADQSVQMVYIEIPDAVDSMKNSEEKFKRKDDPLWKRSKFTVWSSCENKPNDEMRYRYKKCSESSDVRKCPRESAFCGPNPLRGPKVRHIPIDLKH